jgi:hypothetical protein
VKNGIEQHVKWLRARGKEEGWNLAALTGQDARALRVFIAALELLIVCDRAGRVCAIEAMRQAANAMQPQCRFFCKKVIPAALDWADEDRIWLEIQDVKIPFD